MVYQLPETHTDGYSYRVFNDTTGIPHTFIVIYDPDGTPHGYGLSSKNHWISGDGQVTDDVNHPFDSSYPASGFPAIFLSVDAYYNLAVFINDSVA
jgi:hypothetical protein